MKTAYFDCFSGVSGDMVLGAFIDLGVPRDFIETEVGRVISGTFHLEVERAERMGIGGTRVKVVLEGDEASRDYGQIKALIEQSDLADRVKTISLEIFSRLAQVEAHIHGCPTEAVHFHEIGGVDAMVDVIGAVSAKEWLGLEDIWSSEIPVGKGFVTCAHGVLPVPAPATVALLAGVPVVGTSVPAELVTPTGAAIVTTLSNGYGPLPRMHMDRVGYGVGETRLEDRPNLLRIVLGDREAVLHEDQIEVLETNVDDLNPEIFGYLMERLFEDGALDVVWMPVYMKKNRPGVMVQVLCETEKRESIVKRILSETTTTGVRRYKAERKKLRRETKTVRTSLGAVRVKEIRGPDGTTEAPEYDDCRRIAREKDLPLKRVYSRVIFEISKEKQG